MGAGKSTMLAEATDLLAARHVVHAAIDLDALAVGHVGDRARMAELMYRNLESVCRNYRAAGVDRALLAAAVETRGELDRLKVCLDAASLVVCRLRAPLSVMQQRVRLREPGLLQQTFVERVAVLETLLDAAALDDFSIASHDRSVTQTAAEMLERAGWL